MIPPARSVAVHFLEDLFAGPRHIDSLAQESRFLALAPPDRRLVTELVYGVLRNRERLDYYLRKLSRRPLSSLDETVLWILRLALYQIEFLRIPDHAAVHETVELCRCFHKSSATGFVNAVLRSFLRKAPSVPADQSPAALAVRFSHPEWLVKRYLKRFGLKQAETLLSRNNKPPVRFVRINTFKTDLESFCKRLETEGISYDIHASIPDCAVVHSPGFTQHPVYLEGVCFVMDAASQEIAHLAQAGHCCVVGDFCCAPGGKSFIISARLSRKAQLYGCDSSFRRLLETRRRAQLYEMPNLNLVNADLTVSAPFRKEFDLVLVDVPCSGLGTLRSNPDIRWRVHEGDLKRLHAKQVLLLKNSFAVLGKGCELIYATCSTEPEENESVIDEFLAQEVEAQLVGDFHRTYPDPHPGDCFFAARIRRSNR